MTALDNESAMLPLRLLALSLLAVSAQATPTTAPAAGCEAFVDPREVRLRTPDRVVTGRIVAGSVREPDAGRPDIGQQLVFGTADLADVDGGAPVRISYIYWNTVAGCGGWEPGHGGRFVFDLVDDHGRDGALRVMRYGPVAAR